MSMKDDYEKHKDDAFTKNEMAQGVVKILSAAGTAVSVTTALIWVTTTLVPYLGALGIPITAQTVALGLKQLSFSWRSASEEEKRKIIAGIVFFSKVINTIKHFLPI